MVAEIKIVKSFIYISFLQKFYLHVTPKTFLPMQNLSLFKGSDN